MTMQADITTDCRRVIDFFLSPVVKYLDEEMKVR
jgi:hemolysin D